MSRYKSRNFPILENYLDYTFRRLQEESKIVYSKDESKACFNTGLQTQRGKDIFATFFRNRKAEEDNKPDWTFYGFFDSYSDRLRDFSPLPDIAKYYDENNYQDLIFNPRYSIEPNTDHILDNSDRLPDALRENNRMAQNTIEGAIGGLREMIRRNYKIAIPHWYGNKIQLLLPLILTNEEGIADVALVVDRDDDRKIYRGVTILSMDQAYIDARLITKPDDAWLNP